MSTSSKKMLYVGGLAEEVDSKVVHAAFIPFGDIVDVNLPIDFATQKHRGFAFVEFETAQDASDAMDNMNDSEIYGRTIRVNIAKPMKLKEGSARAVWTEDSWLKEFAGAPLTDKDGNLINDPPKESTQGDMDQSEGANAVETSQGDKVDEVEEGMAVE